MHFQCPPARGRRRKSLKRRGGGSRMEGWLSCTAAAPPGKGRRGTQLRPSGSPPSWRQTEFKQGQLFFTAGTPFFFPFSFPFLLPLCSGGLIFTFSFSFVSFFLPPSHLPVLLSGKMQTGSDSSLSPSPFSFRRRKKKQHSLFFSPRVGGSKICEKKFLPSPEEGKGAT